MYFMYSQLPEIKNLPRQEKKRFIKELKSEKKINFIIGAPVLFGIAIVFGNGPYNIDSGGLIGAVLVGGLVGGLIGLILGGPVHLIMLNTVIPKWAQEKVNSWPSE